MATIYGTENSEILNGGTGADFISGGGGNDTLNGNAANDTLNGDAGNDSLVGSTGADILDGGSGADTLSGGIGNDSLYADDLADRGIGGDGTDFYYLDVSGSTTNLSVVVGGAALTVNGTQVANTVELVSLVLGSGNDTVNAGALMSAADGTGGYLDGGLGTDTLILDYSIPSMLGLSATQVSVYAPSEVTVTLAGGLTRSIALNGFERAQITGTAGADYLFSALGDTTLSGGAGYDSLYSYSGNDLLDGGSGDDVVDVRSYSGGADTLSGGIGNDSLYADDLADRGIGGDGVDLYSLTLTGVTSSLSVVLAGAAVTVNGTQVANTIELVSLQLGSGNDTVNAGAFISDADGTGGYLDAGLGTDTLILDYSIPSMLGASAAWVSINATGSGTVGLAGGETRTLSLYGFERAQITGTAGDDYLYGASSVSTLTGGAGNDTLDGSDGNDVLDGGSGDDFISGAGGIDTMSGGIGNDSLYARELGDRVIGGDGTDFYNLDIFESTTNLSVVLAGAAVTVNGTQVANTVEVVSLTLGSGNDTVNAGAAMSGADGTGNYLDAGLGTDTLILNYSVASLQGLTAARVDVDAGSTATATLADGTTRSVSLLGFERAQITGTAGDDYLFAATGASTLTGGGGHDSLYGYLGNDVLDGGAGDDVIDGATNANDADTLSGGIGNDSLSANMLISTQN